MDKRLSVQRPFRAESRYAANGGPKHIGVNQREQPL